MFAYRVVSRFPGCGDRKFTMLVTSDGTKNAVAESCRKEGWIGSTVAVADSAEAAELAAAAEMLAYARQEARVQIKKDAAQKLAASQKEDSLKAAADARAATVAAAKAAVVTAPPPVAMPSAYPAPTIIHQYGTPHPAAPVAKSVSGFGIASLVVSLVAVLICWVPFLGIVAIPFALIGGTLGAIGFIVSLTGGKSGVGMSAAGIVTAVMTIVIAAVVTGSASKVVVDTAHAIGKASEQAATRQSAVTDQAKLRREKSLTLLSVDSLTATKEDIGSKVEYQLTNHTGKAIQAVGGAIRIYDPFGEDIDGLGLDLDSRIADGASISGKGKWHVSPRGVDLLSANPPKATFKFRVKKIMYADGTREDY